MYPIDRRVVARNIYSLIQSIRKTAILVNVSPSTVFRWLKNENRCPYHRRANATKTDAIIECVKTAIACDPFTSNSKLVQIIEKTVNVKVSRELVRIAIKNNGITKKKARFYGRPHNIAVDTDNFILQRQKAIRENKLIISIDETSFGRHGRSVYGYTPKGIPLYVKKNNGPRITTTSALVCVSQYGDIFYTKKPGSYKSVDFIEGLRSFNIPKGSVILLDNASIHKTKLVQDLAISSGFELLHVPPYSPWFNPVEGIFSIVKRHFYKHGDIEASFNAVQQMHIHAFFDKSLGLHAPPAHFFDKQITTCTPDATVNVFVCSPRHFYYFDQKSDGHMGMIRWFGQCLRP